MPIGYMFPGADQLDDQTRRALLGQAAVSMGAQMLQAGGQGRSTAEALGAGLQGGLGTLTRSQQVAMENAMRQKQMEMAQAQEDREQDKYERALDRFQKQQELWYSRQPQGTESTKGTSPGAPTPGSMTPKGIVPQIQQGQFNPSYGAGIQALAAGVDPSVAQMLMPNMGKPEDLQLKEVIGPDGSRYYVPERKAIGMQAPGAAPWRITDSDFMGRRMRYNNQTGQYEWLEPEFAGGGVPGEVPPPPAGPSVLEDVESGTGIKSNLQTLWNNTWGALTEGTPFPETEQARQGIRYFNQNVKQALINSQRYPVYEQKVLQEMLVDPSSLGDPDVAREKMLRLKADLERKLATNTSQLARGGLTEDRFQILTDQNSAIRGILGMMQEPGANLRNLSDEELRRRAEEWERENGGG